MPTLLPAFSGDSYSAVLHSSYLFGKDDKYFELGGGILYVLMEPHALTGPDPTHGSALTSTMGYRYQSSDWPVFFKATLTPFYVLKKNQFWIYTGLSIGYSFN